MWAVKYWDVLLGNPSLSNKQSSSPIFLSQFNEKIHTYSTFLNFPPGVCLIPLLTFWNVGFKYLILILEWFSYHPKDWWSFQFRSCCNEPFLSMWSCDKDIAKAIYFLAVQLYDPGCTNNMLQSYHWRMTSEEWFVGIWFWPQTVG